MNVHVFIGTDAKKVQHDAFMLGGWQKHRIDWPEWSPASPGEERLPVSRAEMVNNFLGSLAKLGHSLTVVTMSDTIVQLIFSLIRNKVVPANAFHFYEGGKLVDHRMDGEGFILFSPFMEDEEIDFHLRFHEAYVDSSNFALLQETIAGESE